MPGHATVTGTFDSDVEADHCIRQLTKIGVPPRFISVDGANSMLLQTTTSQLLKTYQQDKYMVRTSVAGAVVGLIVAICLNVFWTDAVLLRDVGLFTCAMLGAIFGCMAGAVTGGLIGSLISEFPGIVKFELRPKHDVVIAVDIHGHFTVETIRAVFQKCGAVALNITGGDNNIDSDTVPVSYG